MNDKENLGRVFGYARVSTQEQHLDRQLVALRQYVPEESILYDKASGKDTDRPAYKALKGALGLRKGDTLYITSLDRLSRNKQDIKNELEWFRQQGVRLKILDLPTSMIEVPADQGWILDMITNILLEVLASIAEQERLTIRKRQREGIDAAKAAGKHLGRPKAEMSEHFPRVYDEWKHGLISTKKAMEILELKSTTFYRMVKQYEGQ
ncbi:Site-specific DNA recombinase [Lachnospiraceae bacterium XBB2008]|nr:Site-specific DNA recombinase [Lachnospiraceae bacterium XBB2008]